MSSNNSILSGLFVIVLLVIIAVFLYFVYKNNGQSDLNSIKTKISSMDDSIGTLQSTIVTLQNNIGVLQTGLNNKKSLEITDNKGNFNFTPLQVLDNIGYGNCAFLIQRFNSDDGDFGTVLTIIPSKEMTGTYISQIWLSFLSVPKNNTGNPQIYIRTSDDNIGTLLSNTGKNTWGAYKTVGQQN